MSEQVIAAGTVVSGVRFCGRVGCESPGIGSRRGRVAARKAPLILERSSIVPGFVDIHVHGGAAAPTPRRP